jgi:muramoyltetrapeptide carboxypeptidase
VTRAPLRAGDTVAVIAPAGPVPPMRLEAGVRTLRSWGLRVRVGPCARGRHPDLDYLSGTDEQRAAEFTQAWLAPEVTAVFAARGGYGVQRMLDLLDWPRLAAARKVFAGSSDLTALHSALGVRFGLPSWFSPMPGAPLFDADAAEHLRRGLFDPDGARTLRGPAAETLVRGRAGGVVVGGNLALLAAGVGTPEQGTGKGGIVLLEDVDEPLYRLDRMLTQLLRGGWFDGAAGFALGSWTGCGDPARVRSLLLERLGPLGVPMVWELGFGHVPGALTIPLGVPATLDADAATLTVECSTWRPRTVDTAGERLRGHG